VTDRVIVEGADTLAVTLHVAGRRLQDASAPSREVAAFIGTRGRASAPVLTGRLATSVRYAGTEDGAEATSGLAYANRTHWGYARVRQAAQPFLADQVWDNGARITGTYADWVDDVLAGVRGTF
jgi:hypothetical protein